MTRKKIGDKEISFLLESPLSEPVKRDIIGTWLFYNRDGEVGTHEILEGEGWEKMCSFRQGSKDFKPESPVYMKGSYVLLFPFPARNKDLSFPIGWNYRDRSSLIYRLDNNQANEVFNLLQEYEGISYQRECLDEEMKEGLGELDKFEYRRDKREIWKKMEEIRLKVWEILRERNTGRCKGYDLNFYKIIFGVEGGK